MPAISTRLAYALEVKASDLVAALEVDVQFRTIVQTLQLCNMFGGTATITKLPTELIDLVEKHIEVDKLEAIAQRRHQVKKLYQCAEGSCSAYDHMSFAEKLTRLNGVMKRLGKDEVKSLQESQLAPWKMQSFVMEQYPDGKGHQELGVGVEEHLLACWTSMLRISRSGGNCDLVRRYYGLEVFAAHRDSGDRQETCTYLVLPDESSRHRETDLERFDEKPDHQEIGFGVAREINAPEELTDGEKSRLVEMLTGLAMPGWDSGDDEEKQELLDRAAGTLKMLTYVRVEQCSRRHQEDRKVDASVPWAELDNLELENKEE
ncbi:hypothetical protein LTR97_001113 [Elasticomyces elasticus]|uniref:Uncharacterized protein n=1 Tax=Elasticomyces elasticus TaxID=574655 RepID=A0AAN7WC08_9PEZI|nr:hypothetical protein LTR97_001113 [Elasticomyces elasticus]